MTPTPTRDDGFRTASSYRVVVSGSASVRTTRGRARVDCKGEQALGSRLSRERSARAREGEVGWKRNGFVDAPERDD